MSLFGEVGQNHFGKIEFLNLSHEQACTLCPVLVASRRRIVHGYGDPSSRVVFVGEAPGQRGADQTGVPFTSDKSGARLQRMLHRLGLLVGEVPSERPQLRCFVTNAVRCCPPNNRTPTPSEVANCRPYLETELTRIEPHVIVPIGRVALGEIGMRYLGRDLGSIRAAHAIPIHIGQRIIVPLVHPSRISNAQIEAFVAGMQQVLKQVEG